MVRWLNSKDNRQGDSKLWGSKLSTFHFTELLEWLKKGGSMKKKKVMAIQASASAPGISKNVSTAKSSASSSKKKPSGSKAGNSRRK